MKLVSVIIPYYKKRNYIKETLNSIFNQSYKNYEIIIIYDDEDLNDYYFLKKLIKKKKNIKLVKNKKQVGAGFSRNIAISISRGDYIAFIDADDLWKKGKLKNQLNFMLKKKISVSHTSYEILNNSKIKPIRLAKNFFHLNDILLSCDIGLSTVMIKSVVFENPELKFPKIQTKEDFVLWMKLLKNNYKIYGLNKSLTIWRKVENSLSNSIFQKLKDSYLVYNKYMKFNFILSIIFAFFLCLNFLKKNFK
jgi:teichuronic acid biosynthesis glycosyltransferase TuaG